VVVDGTSDLIPGGYHVLPVHLVIPAAGSPKARQSEPASDVAALVALSPAFSRGIDVAATYNLAIIARDYTPSSSTIARQYSWRNLTDSDNDNLNRSLETILDCIEALPLGFVTTTSLQSVAFVGDVQFLGLDVGAGFDVNERTIIIEVNDFFKDVHLKNAFFHEYMHLIDNIFMSKGYFDNEKWAALNPPGDIYTQAGALAMIRDNPSYVSEEHPVKGFVNGYSLADIYQDKAEVFSWLFITPYYRKAHEWMEDDPFLKAKFDFMIGALGKMSPIFTHEYFENLHR
jgi:hypothetical protein